MYLPELRGRRAGVGGGTQPRAAPATRSLSPATRRRRPGARAQPRAAAAPQTFRALEYIHARRICHRDIKPDNLLVDPQTLHCRLCDFGCSKILVKGQPNVSYICSRYYRAPELMFGATEYGVAVDVWSVGTVLAELLLGHLPFQGQDSTQQHLVRHPLAIRKLGTRPPHPLAPSPPHPPSHTRLFTPAHPHPPLPRSRL